MNIIIGLLTIVITAGFLKYILGVEENDEICMYTIAFIVLGIPICWVIGFVMKIMI